MSSRSARTLRWLFLAVVAFACFVALGLDVVRQGEPPTLLIWQQSLVNHSALVAWWLTWSCYPAALIPVAVVLLFLAWRFPAWRARIVVSVVTLLLCWRGADLFQHVFGRPRQLDWVVKREKSFSYPSSHATIAFGFYAFWAAMLYFSELPARVRTIGALLLAAFALAVCWSRLALGAHYVTDLIGGALLAVAIVSAAMAVVPIGAPSPSAGRPYRPAE